MALVLELQKGQDVFLCEGMDESRDVRVLVDDITNEYNFIVTVSDKSGSQDYRVTDEYLTNILEGVKISAGKNHNNRGTVKICFELPRRISVVRGILYRKGIRNVIKGMKAQ